MQPKPLWECDSSREQFLRLNSVSTVVIEDPGLAPPSKGFSEQPLLATNLANTLPAREHFRSHQQAALVVPYTG